MKKKSLFVGLLLSLSSIAMGQTTQAVAWVNQVGGNAVWNPSLIRDQINSIHEDGYGNVYLVGSFRGTMSVPVYTASNPNGYATTAAPVMQTLVSAGGADGFIMRVDKFGKCTWLTQVGGAGEDEIKSVYTNATTGVPTIIYVGGKFTNQTSVGPSLTAVNSGLGTDAMFIKYTLASAQSAPVFAWANNFGGGGEACATGIVSDGTNAYATGYYSEFAFDNGGVINFYKKLINGNNGPYTTTSPGYLEFPNRDMFLVKITGSTGVFSAGIQSVGSDDQNEGHGIAINGTNLYLVGTYKGALKLNATSLSCNGHSDIFVSRYTTSFTSASVASAALKLGSNSDTYYQANTSQTAFIPDNGAAIAANSNGVFVTGTFQNSINVADIPTIDPDPASVSDNYAFVARYSATLQNTDAQTDVVVGSNGRSEGRSIYLKGSGTNASVYVAGCAYSNAKFNGTPVENSNAFGVMTGFVSLQNFNSSVGNIKFDNALGTNFVDGISTDNFQYQGSSIGTNFEALVSGNAISAKSTCGIILGGFFQNKEFFGNHLVEANGGTDAFLLYRDNALTVTSSFPTCDFNPVTLSANSGLTSYAWSTNGTTTSTTNTQIVTPNTNQNSWYNLNAVNGTCPAVNTPVVVYNTGANLVLNGDFSWGNTGFSSSIPYSTSCTGGSYAVGPQLISKCPSNANWIAANFYDHSSLLGNFLIIDGVSSGTMTFWQQTVSAVQPNTDYIFSFWARNIYSTNQFPVNFVVNTGGSDVIVGTSTNILNGAWRQYSITWSSGSNSGPVTLKLQCSGNAYRDFGVDDVSFAQACPFQRSAETAVDEVVEKSDVVLYPNPTNGIINLNFIPENVKTIEVMDALGNMIQSHVLNGATNAQFDLNGMAKGIYFVRLISETGSEVHRVILQ